MRLIRAVSSVIVSATYCDRYVKYAPLLRACSALLTPETRRSQLLSLLLRACSRLALSSA